MCVLWIQAVPFCEQAKAEQPQDVHKVLKYIVNLGRVSPANNVNITFT